MKKSHRNKLTTLVFMAGVFLSCEIENIVPVNNQGTFSASINNITFQAIEIEANLYTTGIDSLIEINATSEDQSILKISVKSLEPGIYNSMTKVSCKYFKSLGNGVTSSENASSGSITVLSYDNISKKLSGTFEFKTNSYTISNGKFNDINIK